MSMYSAMYDIFLASNVFLRQGCNMVFRDVSDARYISQFSMIIISSRTCDMRYVLCGRCYVICDVCSLTDT